ncbi:hypothetical protein OG331_15930 [Streptomyces sp. NBC_01017]|uniref:hypothetical protein n=1 Tax=Streptomyces sp. NBC_01017 TaxID=2903721 RepID=UPI00386AEED3|nr:hypothetical protein OG331_15930 [Streptomyces sp. NBC_01017]
MTSLEEAAGLGAFAEWWEQQREERALKQRKHEEHLSSPQYLGQLKRLDRLTEAAINLVYMSHVGISRMPNATDTYLVFAGTDDALECIVAIRALVAQGVHNVARRECRYLLEQAVKFLYVDQQCPSLSVTREQRIEFLKKEVPRSSIQPIFDVAPLLPSEEVRRFQEEVKGRWSSLSGIVHPSKEQIDERAARARRGAFSGFETAKDLTTMNNQLASVYDCLGVMWLTAAGPSIAGDLILELDQEEWIFHKSKWLQKLSRQYDYKLERQTSTPKGEKMIEDSEF